jgi:lysozyme
MATSPDKGFLEQLREMRNTRMQQLRQGGQQAGLLNKQIAAITTLNKTMESVLRAQSSSNATLKNLSTSQTNVSRQTEQMSKSINNLSSSITRSMGSVASAVGKGASGAASVAGSAGGAVVGAASSVASGVASAVAKVLPFAIAGVVGKMMVWDNMDDSVKKDLTDSFGGLVKSIFGGVDTSGLKKVTAPITKEFGIVFGALGDTMEGVTNKLSVLVKKFEGMSDNLERIMKGIKGGGDSSTSTPGRQKSMAEREARATAATGKIIGQDIGNVASAAKDLLSENTGTAINVASGAVLAAGGYGTIKKLRGNEGLKSVDKPGLASSKDISRMQDKLSRFQNKQAVKKNIKGLLDNRIIQATKKIGGPIVGKAFDLLKKFPKLSIAGALIEVGLLYIVLASVDGLFEEEEITEEERDELKSYFKKQSAVSAIGATVGGVAGGAAAGLFGVSTGGVGLVAAPALVALGGYGGKLVADYLGSQLIKVPDVLKEPSDRLDFATQGNVSKLRDRKDPGGSGKRTGAITPSATMSDTQQVNLTRSLIDYIKETEGFKARPYGDYKQLSIGYGTKANSPDDVVDEKEAEKRMIEKLTDFQKTVLSYNNKYGYNWTQSQIDALTSFTYNAGEGNLKKLLGDGKRSNEEIAAKMKEYNIAGGKVNPGLIKRREVEMSLFAGGGNTGSNTIAQASMTNQSLSYNENVARRRQEAKEAEKYEEGSDSLVGPVPPKPEKKKPLSDFARQFSFQSFAEGFKTRTSELENVINSMATVKDIKQSTTEIEKEKAKSMQGINIIDQSTNVSSSSGGGGGGITVTPVTSDHSSNKNWQFNTMAGGYRA